MNLIILGPPGSGKGTQAALLAKKFHLVHFSVGEALRQEAEQHTRIKTILERGDLVPDRMSFALVKKRLPKQNFILDGFPRDLSQAKLLSKIISVDHVLYLDCTHKKLIERLSHRGRSDDLRKTITHRLQVYKKEIQPLLDYYADALVHFKGDDEIPLVFTKICSFLKRER